MDKVMTFLKFDKMISATLIKWLFYISLVAVTLAGLFYMFNGSFFGGLLTIVLGVLFVRVYCEVMIILFKIHESLNEIKNK
jgi:hypothetical protein